MPNSTRTTLGPEKWNEGDFFSEIAGRTLLLLFRLLFLRQAPLYAFNFFVSGLPRQLSCGLRNRPRRYRCYAPDPSAPVRDAYHVREDGTHVQRHDPKSLDAISFSEI